MATKKTNLYAKKQRSPVRNSTKSSSSKSSSSVNPSPRKDDASAPSFDSYQIIKYPLSTEKSIRMIEFDNKLVFAVHPRATKKDIKRAVEEMFKVKVAQVNLHNAFQGQKRAF